MDRVYNCHEPTGLAQRCAVGHPLIVAELSSNPAPWWHLDPFLDAAQKAGADAVKIQLFDPNHFPLAERISKRAAMLPRLKLEQFAKDARDRGLLAGASVFDKMDVVDASHLDFLKLATREEHNLGLRLRAWLTGLPIFRSVDWRHVTRKPIHLPREFTLGCVPEYPSLNTAPLNLAEKLPKPYGWSSHCASIRVCVAAAREGASVIEAHLCTSRRQPEGKWSLSPRQFAMMVAEIRWVT